MAKVTPEALVPTSASSNTIQTYAVSRNIHTAIRPALMDLTGFPTSASACHFLALARDHVPPPANDVKLEAIFTREQMTDNMEGKQHKIIVCLGIFHTGFVTYHPPCRLSDTKAHYPWRRWERSWTPQF